MQFFVLLLLILVFIVDVCGVALGIKQDYKLLRSFEHDAHSFTQGLIYRNGYLYESGGLYRQSSLRKVDAQTGKVLTSTPLPNRFFAEGIAVVGDVLYMLTWREQTMMIFDLNTMTIVDQQSYRTHNGQGWGLTYDGENLIASDGSHFLTTFELPKIRDNNNKPLGNGPLVALGQPQLKKVRQVSVTRGGKPVKMVNELEYVDGYIYANIWYKDEIIKIDPVSGVVVQTIDLRSLWPKEMRNKEADCLNGIAYNRSEDSFILTGKLWPKYYKVAFPRGQTISEAATKGKYTELK